MIWKTFMLCVIVLMCMPAFAHAGITELIIERVSPFAAGHVFGKAGVYERVQGVALGTLDPAAVGNQGIVNLDKAPRNSQGLVEYETRFDMLRPKVPAKKQHMLLCDIPNRGRKFLLHWVFDAPAQAESAVNDPQSLADAGMDYFFRRGYIFLWSGWEDGLDTRAGQLTMKQPVAVNSDGMPVADVIREEFVYGARTAPAETFRLAYEVADSARMRAALSVRRTADDAPQVLPSSAWTYVDNRTVRLQPEGTLPEPGVVYDFTYPAHRPRIGGVGFAATRDLVSYVREQAGKEATPHRIKRAMAIGISQSGRYLRDFIAGGYNASEAGHKVFDGVISHIGGAGGVFLNEPFAQPGRTFTAYEDHWFPEMTYPFSMAGTPDHLGRPVASRLPGTALDPLVMEVNTSTEYWQKGASLIHTTTDGKQDLTLPDTVRVYLASGTQHNGRVGLGRERGAAMNELNPHNPAPLLRGLLLAMERWTSESTLPPPSMVPTISTNMLVDVAALQFPDLPGVAVPHKVNSYTEFGNWRDPQPDAARTYTFKVPQVDADGNEIGGVLLPDVAVPLATYTGWNIYRHPPFPQDELADRDGSFVPLAVNTAARQTTGDTRLSIAERYANHRAYVKKVSATARELVRQKLMLKEDAAACIKRAQSAEIKALFER